MLSSYVSFALPYVTSERTMASMANETEEILKILILFVVLFAISVYVYRALRIGAMTP